jgi:hypothetical protein
MHYQRILCVTIATLCLSTVSSTPVSSHSNAVESSLMDHRPDPYIPRRQDRTNMARRNNLPARNIDVEEDRPPMMQSRRTIAIPLPIEIPLPIVIPPLIAIRRFNAPLYPTSETINEEVIEH